MRASLRVLIAPTVALAMMAAAGLATRMPSADTVTRARLAARFRFVHSALNGGPARAAQLRDVAPSLYRIRSWISAVGASVALADVSGDGRGDDVCLVDPRDDSVTVRPAPGTGGRYAPFALVPRSLWWNPRTMAPMGCVPGDFNLDGRTDLLAFYWGRSPVLFLRARPGALSAAAFQPRELVRPAKVWNTETVNIADVDGDGHPDVIVGNYFPDGARVLDPSARRDPKMRLQDGMSNAANAGTGHILLWRSGTGGARPTATFTDQPHALPDRARTSWTLATGAQDLNGDGRPEPYFANDFGRDNLLVNDSTPGRVRLATATGRRGLTMPKSKALGADSFKGMGVAFAQLDRADRPYILVSNITLPYALEESNFAFAPTGPAGELARGTAPYTDRSESLGLARSGWAWDIKTGDFTNTGDQQILQAMGFIDGGHTNRWPQLQELAMANDDLLREPAMWPNFQPGDDLSGDAGNRFFVRTPGGRYTDLSSRLGLDQPVPSRAFALSDTDHDGRLDFAVANQWGRSAFYRNASRAGHYLGLWLRMPAITGSGFVPAIGATVTVYGPDGRTQTRQVYPANGHTGVSSPELLFGLGFGDKRPVPVRITWRDASGPHSTTRTLAPGWHTVDL